MTAKSQPPIQSFKSAEEALEALYGERPDEVEMLEGALRVDELTASLDYLAQSLVDRRNRLGKTQTEVAAETGIPQSVLSRLERQLSKGTTLGSLLDYADALGLELTFREKDYGTMSAVSLEQSVSDTLLASGALLTKAMRGAEARPAALRAALFKELAAQIADFGPLEVKGLSIDKMGIDYEDVTLSFQNLLGTLPKHSTVDVPVRIPREAVDRMVTFQTAKRSKFEEF